MKSGCGSDVPAHPRKQLMLATFLEGKPTDGGGYVHKVGALRVLSAMQGPELSVVVICADAQALAAAEAIGLRGVIFRRRGWRRLLGAVSATEFMRVRFGKSLAPALSPLDRLLSRLKVDLAYFPNPDHRALQLLSHGYVFSILDLTHIEHPEFPEVAMYGEFERREKVFSQATRRAVAVIVDSEPTRRFIAEQYRVPVTRVFAAPFLISASTCGFKPDPTVASEIRRRYNLADPYIFYPAQFWLHKNHKYILEAISLLRERDGWAPQAVFCGSDKGALKSVLARATELGVNHLVRYCGFVPDADIPYLYAGAMALVMPTYCGPNNIPPVEAQSFGIPVCYSDFPAFREQMGNSVLYIDLEDPASLANVLGQLRRAGGNVRQESHAGDNDQHERAQITYRRVLEGVIEKFRRKVF